MAGLPVASGDRKRGSEARAIALRFVFLIGVLSFFADFTYEGSRSILGPFLATLGATGLIVAAVTGFGELAGYGLRLVSGRLAGISGRYWPITIFGYAVQMASVPALALAHSWPVAAALIVTERIGKAIRNPPRDVMLSHAARDAGGYGWVFGLHEALDQFGALAGPLAVAAILAHRGNYRLAFVALLVPALLNLILVLVARFLYPRPQDMDRAAIDSAGTKWSSAFWIYLTGAALVAAGFADYPLIAFHFTASHVVPAGWIAVLYAIAMAAGGAGSVVSGRLFDRFGFSVLIVLTIASAAFAPLVFLAGFWGALTGAAIWGLGMSVHESLIPAAVALMVPDRRRASAFGLFSGAYGTAWFLGSVATGLLYDRSIPLLVGFCVVTQFGAAPLYLWAAHRTGLPPTIAQP